MFGDAICDFYPVSYAIADDLGAPSISGTSSGDQKYSIYFTPHKGPAISLRYASKLQSVRQNLVVYTYGFRTCSDIYWISYKSRRPRLGINIRTVPLNARLKRNYASKNPLENPQTVSQSCTENFESIKSCASRPNPKNVTFSTNSTLHVTRQKRISRYRLYTVYTNYTVNHALRNRDCKANAPSTMPRDVMAEVGLTVQRSLIFEITHRWSLLTHLHQKSSLAAHRVRYQRNQTREEVTSSRLIHLMSCCHSARRWLGISL